MNKPAKPDALDREIVEALRGQLPAVAELVVAAVIDEVPSYTDAWNGPMGTTIAEAVRLALGGFVYLIGAGGASDAGTPLQPALDGAYALGRGEARSGRTMEALLAAYRVGARVAWREMSATAVTAKLPADQLARFAEFVFAYIDELSAASAFGHADELATTGRVRARYLERLAQDLLSGAPDDALVGAADRADWQPPEAIVAVLLPSSQVRAALSGLDPRTLEVTDESRDAADADTWSVLLVPSEGRSARQFLLRHLAGRNAVVGPARPWLRAAASYQRAKRVVALASDTAGAAVDSEAHLAWLVCTADPDALADLRRQALAPLSDLRPATAERLVDTLRSWLLHQGRREEVAADLVVHPQTVRYRMTQLRELYGDALSDPRTIGELTIALAIS
ncbi:MAG TPA: helix-turn-helix domain-containing protein [Mycobacteriales bacterium]|nr:helix-turn-helix domain-containing protein [Mycobacteriales bacterium]